MSDDIEVHYDAARGQMTLTCGEITFARLLDGLCLEATVRETVGESASTVRLIEIERASKAAHGSSGAPWVFFWLGCLVTAGVFGFVLVVGLTVVVQWIARLFS